MKIILPLSILAYMCSLLPFLRTWDSNYRYANYCYNGDIFVEGYGFPCLVVGDDAIIEIFIYSMPILALAIIIFGIVALFNLFKGNFAALCYAIFLAVAEIAIIIMTLLLTGLTLFLAGKVGDICVYNEGSPMPCLIVTPSFITIYSICLVLSLVLIGILHKWVFCFLGLSD